MKTHLLLFLCVLGLAVAQQSTITLQHTGGPAETLAQPAINPVVQSTTLELRGAMTPEEETRWRHKLNCDMARSGIIAGYLACRLGIPLSNYLASVEKEWDAQLKTRLAEDK